MSIEDREAVAGGRLAPKSWRPPTIDVDESELRESIADALAERLGARVDVVSLVRMPSPYAMLFPADVVEVRMADGGVVTLFVKYLGDEERGHPDKLGPEREICLYRDVLVGEGLPVVRFFGAPWHPRCLLAHSRFPQTLDRALLPKARIAYPCSGTAASCRDWTGTTSGGGPGEPLTWPRVGGWIWTGG